MKIAHISDIHIRLSSRHEEYKKVFKRLFSSLKEKRVESIVVAGDILHSKTELTPEALVLTDYFFEGLGKIAPTYVILGNHDCNLKNTERMDSLSPIFKIKKKFDHVKLLTSIESISLNQHTDMHFFSMLHMDQKPAISDPAKINIAVAHGMIAGSKSETGFTFMSGDYKLADFNEFDIVMLGDIHKRQDIDNKTTTAYSGSLVQQNFGEEDEKGYLLWDTDTLTKTFVPIKNDYGFRTVTIKGFDYPDKLRNQPKHLNLRVLWHMPTYDIVNSEFIRLHADLRKLYKPDALTVISVPPDHHQKEIGVTGEFDIHKYVEKALTEMGHKYELTDDQIRQLIDLDGEFDLRIECDEKSQKPWTPKELAFDNIFSYGKNTNINLDNRGITGIFAPNATGKSGLIDSFLYSVYGKVSRTPNVREIIKKGTRSCRSSIHISMDGNLYRINRKAKLINVKLKITSGPRITRATGGVDFEKFNGKEWISLNGIDKKETDKAISDHFGTIDDFLLTSFSAQGDLTKFIETQATDRKDILIRFLGLDFMESKYALVKNRAKEMDTNIKVLNRYISDTNIDELENRLEIIQKDIDSYKGKIEKTELKDIREVDDMLQQIQTYKSTLSTENLKLKHLRETAKLFEKKAKPISLISPVKHGGCNICPLLSEAKESFESFKEKKKEISEKEGLISDIEALLTNFNEVELLRQKDEYVEASEGWKNKLIELHGERSSINSSMGIWRSRVVELKGLEENRKVLDVYAKATHRDGIPYQTILEYLPIINLEVNSILSGIVDFSIFITPDNTDKRALQVRLSYEDKEDRIIDVASGMEKMLTSLALRAALIKISRLPKPTIWIIDEGFGALDRDNLQSMRNLFQKLKSMFTNILIISHVSQLRDAVDNEIQIDKTKNGSKILA